MKVALSALAIAIAASSALAQDRFMPTASCTQVAGFDDAAEHRAMELYLYFAATSLLGQPLPDTPETFAELRRRTGAVCVEMPYGSSIEAAVTALVASLDASAPSLEDEARALLSRFLQPGANLNALTAALRPSDEDLAQIFKPQAVPAISVYVENIFDRGTVSPNAGQTELLLVLASTSELIDRKPVLGEFPGGYADLLPYLHRDIPIARFKFVEPGETIGMAFDGLYKVGDRWVMIPKGWRALP